ncbi:hypothetical protein LCGC14_1157420 [marine sediment metagenome]|uniref:ABC transporter domain-containing protein n=1 Tax=marine sediment metagenome TaxID=412755 RepID=A0A0F9PBY7_9ZZZZ
MTKEIIRTFNITKDYKLKGGKEVLRALDDVNISINEGKIFGLLGPNGAGKTTLIQILTTILQPTSGYAIINGHNILKKPKLAKSNIALMLESDMLYYRITAFDNLKFFCKIYNIPNYEEKIKKMVGEFGLEKWLFQYVENFSSGMKMKLALCRTLLLERKILFLDEPTLGLDVKSVSFIVNKLKNINKTIFLTSHDMNVVEKLCNRIAFINNGKILKIGDKHDIKKLEQRGIEIVITIEGNKERLISELKSQEFIDEVLSNKNKLSLILNDRQNYDKLFSILSRYKILKILEKELSLEDLFINLM